LDFRSLVAGGHVEGDLPPDGVAGVDVIEPRAALAVGSGKVNVDRAVGAEFPAMGVVEVLGAVVKCLALAPDVGDLQGDDGVPALSGVSEPNRGIADALGVGD